ncbi:MULTISPECIES: N-6 DNA methylase [unclassified Bradyrhizobium]|uniref:N-6 DNA methylase n=1 Tax=unclassified Bradyrhizobium TaxID=2631580 RepID=UPI002916C71B|nr:MULTISPECIES: N-6 DNA methylase [unclassified Bradyrhizobium]
MAIKRNDVRLNTDAHRPARDLFVERINAICSREGWRPYEALTHTIDATFRSMRSATLQFQPERLAANEAEYMKIVQRCRKPSESMEDIAAMLAAIVSALEAEPIDFIGPIFEELAASSHLGQFFTPYHVSRLMADLIIAEPDRMLAETKRGFITLQEPACGVGGMTLAACAVLRERGINLATQVHWTMVDVDYTAAAAAYIQTNLCGVSADIFHGNTLALKTWLATPTLAAILHTKRVRYEQEAKLPAPPLPNAPRRKPVQLSLFAEETADAAV